MLRYINRENNVVVVFHYHVMHVSDMHTHDSFALVPPLTLFFKDSLIYMGQGLYIDVLGV